jgi:hypothetical protein
VHLAPDAGVDAGVGEEPLLCCDSEKRAVCNPFLTDGTGGRGPGIEVGVKVYNAAQVGYLFSHSILHRRREIT